MSREPDAWDAAAALHAEAHDDGDFYGCREATCVSMKDALVPYWRDATPAVIGPRYPDAPWMPGHDCEEHVGPCWECLQWEGHNCAKELAKDYGVSRADVERWLRAAAEIAGQPAGVSPA